MTDALAIFEDSSYPAEVGSDAARPEEIDFFDLSRDELAQLLKDRFDEPPFRAVQLFQWVYKRGVQDFSEMSDLSRKFREAFGAVVRFPKGIIRDRQISRDGTRKYLVEVDRGECVEAVMIKQPTRMTLCVSSQLGCGMGCKFCRTATMGFKRHLRTSEIIRQVRAVIEDAANFGDMFSNVVFMGMGEPLHNLDGVTRAVNVLTDPHAFGIGPRKVTVSTVGLVPAIREFGERSSANLAVSLNATTDEVRAQIMPVNKAYPIETLVAALRDYPRKKRRRITIEYVMLSGLNDTDADLSRLPKLLRGVPAKVNLIPYNENAGLGFRAPSREQVARWQSELSERGLDVTVRWSKGIDIAAACGQLATEFGKKKPIAPLLLNATE
jgi:23S rRNA (adenine2503-C2)-methyltransferase